MSQLTTKEWLDTIKNHSDDISMLCDQLKSHLDIYGEDGTFLSGTMHLLSAYKDLRKFLIDTSHEAYKSEL